MGWKLSVAAAISACLMASPVAAANIDNIFPAHSEQSRIGAYAGATLSFRRTSARSAGPSLRLGVGSRHSAGPTATQLSFRPDPVFELDLTAKRRPELYLGGRRLSAAEGDGGWGTGEILLAIAGAAAAVFLITAVADSGDDDDDDQCMIEPELCD